MVAMKKILAGLFPLLFALAAFLFYLVLFPARRGNGQFFMALMVLAAALGWSALICFAGRGPVRLKFLYVGTAILLSVLSPALAFFRPDRLPHAIALALILLGMLGITLYLRFNSRR